MTIEERKEEVLEALRSKCAAEVARANPFDKFLLWASWLAEDAFFKTADLDNAEDCRWLDGFLNESYVGGGRDKRHVPERNPLVKEVCRQAYDELAEGAA